MTPPVHEPGPEAGADDVLAADHPPEVRATAARLAPLLMDDMRRRARRERRRVNAGETLRTTALVHEAWLRLRGQGQWNDDAHFLRTAALAMRQALVDHARARLAAKRGAGAVDSLDAIDFEPWWISDEALLDLDEALGRLGELSPRLARVVECRFFAGYSDEDTAHILAVTSRTVRRDWQKARAWLHRELMGDALASAPDGHDP